ncbi:MAG: TPR end-of-group domain-containing protein, partial [Myxococcales bacterium]
GKSRESLKALRSAVDNGYSDIEEMDRDPDLQSIRLDPEYRKIRKLAESRTGRIR